MSTGSWPTSSPTCARAATRRCVDYTRKFDRVDTDAAGLRIADAERAAAAAKVPAAQREALEFAAKRIEAFHRELLPKDVDFTDYTGTRLGARYRPLDSVGVYVPGGTAAYPSSVLMNIVPAKVAGVKRIVMVVPTPDGVLNPLVMLAAEIAGADEVWRIGGAQAVAALAYGTQSITPVDKITGPGNAYVAAAKRRVFGQVGIDLIAGPSEILVVADGHNDPAWIAADLLSQAEHDRFVAVGADRRRCGLRRCRRRRRRDAQLKTHAARRDRRRELARQWLHHPGAATSRPVRRSSTRIAAEHVELAMEPEPAEALSQQHLPCRRDLHRPPHARGDRRLRRRHQPCAADLARGALLGRPRRRRFPEAHLDRRLHAESLAALGPAALALAEAEGLDAHGRSVSIRLNRRG